ncbi:metallophosphatase family protein [Limnohabitans sp. JirII-29]|uniref:metallophosphoesterase family protein n=1 Tax=Limnohabitans sp. JirII-29 TaxID=1835756 RepID=UPI000D3828F3|nr:metallophosphoesterase family protein [Limnohabitans sp. JirII-29]PUE29088.1 metallophosphatase family protein [Limnohabitans sp. JirII-29]
MKYALLSDIHGNLHAFEACLAHAKAQGAERIAVLGDLVGYGAFPAEVVTRCQDIQAQGGIVLRGNHEELIQSHNLNDASANLSLGSQTAHWTHDQLSPAQRFWLEILPLTACEDSVLLVHASADAPERWRYVEDERTASLSLDAAMQDPAVRYVFGGHVHHQSLFYRGTGRQLMRFEPSPGVAIPTPKHRHWIATVGSVGQPRDGNPRAMYALFDSSAAKLTFHRVAYDHMAAARCVREAGLPEFFAERLETGR